VVPVAGPFDGFEVGFWKIPENLIKVGIFYIIGIFVPDEKCGFVKQFFRFDPFENFSTIIFLVFLNTPLKKFHIFIKLKFTKRISTK
jgi:hypothetical protein